MVRNRQSMAKNLDIKRRLAGPIVAHLKEMEQTQAVLAERIGVAQSEISYLLNNHLEHFTIDWLLMLADQLGFISIVETHKSP